LARRRSSLSTLSSITRRRSNKCILRRCLSVMATGWMRRCMERVAAAGEIAEGEEDFDTRYTPMKYYITN
jgi:hypothetical protein